MTIKSLLFDHVFDPLRDAIKLRLDYFLASKSRWVALSFLIAILITMLSIPEINLTGTRWAAFLPLIASYIMGRLSAGVAIFEYAHKTHQGSVSLGFVGGDIDDSGDWIEKHQNKDEDNKITSSFWLENNDRLQAE